MGRIWNYLGHQGGKQCTLLELQRIMADTLRWRVFCDDQCIFWLSSKCVLIQKSYKIHVHLNVYSPCRIHFSQTPEQLKKPCHIGLRRLVMMMVTLKGLGKLGWSLFPSVHVASWTSPTYLPKLLFLFLSTWPYLGLTHKPGYFQITSSH